MYYHLMPLNDSYPHQHGLGCECCPELDENNPNIIVHKAYDSRPKPEDWLTELANREH